MHCLRAGFLTHTGVPGVRVVFEDERAVDLGGLTTDLITLLWSRVPDLQATFRELYVLLPTAQQELYLPTRSVNNTSDEMAVSGLAFLLAWTLARGLPVPRLLSRGLLAFTLCDPLSDAQAIEIAMHFEPELRNVLGTLQDQPLSAEHRDWLQENDLLPADQGLRGAALSAAVARLRLTDGNIVEFRAAFERTLGEARCGALRGCFGALEPLIVVQSLYPSDIMTTRHLLRRVDFEGGTHTLAQLDEQKSELKIRR